MAQTRHWDASPKVSELEIDGDIDLGAHALLSTNLSMYEGSASYWFVKDRAKSNFQRVKGSVMEATSELKSNIISEYSGADGVNVDTLKLKNGALGTAKPATQILTGGGATAWADINATSVVGANKCFIFLKVVRSGAGYVDVRGPSDQEDMEAPNYYRMILGAGGIARIQVYSPDGHIDYLKENVAGTVDIYVEGYIPMVE